MKNKKGTKNVNWKNSQMYALDRQNDHRMLHFYNTTTRPSERLLRQEKEHLFILLLFYSSKFFSYIFIFSSVNSSLCRCYSTFDSIRYVMMFSNLFFVCVCMLKTFIVIPFFLSFNKMALIPTSTNSLPLFIIIKRIQTQKKERLFGPGNIFLV